MIFWNKKEGCCLALVCMLGCGLSAATEAATNMAVAPYLSKLEKEILVELNLARTSPQKYMEFVQAFRKQFINAKEYKAGKRLKITTKEGTNAVMEAIEFLRTAKPLPALEPSQGLSLAAKDHVKDIGPKGIVGHDGTDGSTATKRAERHGTWEAIVGENIAFGPRVAREIVVQLIVDDGVADRGHRTNIFLPKYGVVGIACGPHTKYENMCVMDFAGGFKDAPVTNKAAGK